MRTIVTGTVGLDKGAYLEKVAAFAHRDGHNAQLCHIGDRMYAEAPDVVPGRILDLPLSRLHLLRRSIIKDVLRESREQDHCLVNTHATFRWRHGLFPAFDFDQLAQFDADVYLCLMDTVDKVHARLLAEHQVDHSLKDLLVWREEEILATEMMMMGSSLARNGSPARFYIMAVGAENSTAELCYRLLFQPHRPKAYIGFPMTHVADLPDIQQEIIDFRQVIQQHFTVFNPADMEEYEFYQSALEASQLGHKIVETEVLGRTLRFDVAEVLQVAGDINAQIYARDFMLIDQADMIISYIPELPSGKPGLSSGVERELQHAYEATREVYVIWRPDATPSPFITETATKVFNTTDQAIEYFKQKGHIET